MPNEIKILSEWQSFSNFYLGFQSGARKIGGVQNLKTLLLLKFIVYGLIRAN